jgi:hypothetical protein
VHALQFTVATRDVSTCSPTAMHIKRRGHLACLYRSRWVPKGTDGNTHGYTQQTFVGSLSGASLAIPEPLAVKLTEAERAYIERNICSVARKAAEQTLAENSRREADPGWRLTEAERLVNEAAERSQRRRVSRDCISPISNALARVCTFGSTEASVQTKRADPMLDALTAIRVAAAAVRDGSLGAAPSSGARTTRIYATWAKIVAEIEGSSEGSLLAALQLQGFVKRRRG